MANGCDFCKLSDKEEKTISERGGVYLCVEKMKGKKRLDLSYMIGNENT